MLRKASFERVYFYVYDAFISLASECVFVEGEGEFYSYLDICGLQILKVSRNLENLCILWDRSHEIHLDF